MTTWRFEDARGVSHEGHVESVVDRGGTDVTYFMRTECGTRVVLSGMRLKAATTRYDAAPADCQHGAPASGSEVPTN